ncbi:MAG: universal stress protein [Pseudomonadota bacterium]
MRKFLVVLDDTPECINAMRFAAIRAHKTGGGVELLAIIPPEEFQHWIGVGERMRSEAHARIHAHYEIFKGELEKNEDITPTLAIREGERVTEILAHIQSDSEIGVLVLGARAKGDGPGPLVADLTGGRVNDMHVPITVVPGTMTKEEIVAVS